MLYIKAGDINDFYATLHIQQRYIDYKEDGFPEDYHYLGNEERSFRIKKNGNRYIAGNMTPYEYIDGYIGIHELVEPLEKNTSTDDKFSFTITKE